MKYWMYVLLSLFFAVLAFVALDYFWDENTGAAVALAAFCALLSAGIYPSSRKDYAP